MNTSAKKATLLSSIGAGFEYYDFIVYGMMAEYLSPLFFSSDEAWIGIAKTFAVFAVGYLIRPFGGIFFGMIGDTYGRKHSFLAVMLLMAISTFGIGLLPTYQQLGAWAPCLLIFLRMCQGLSFGAELPGAITIVNEFTDKKKQSTYSGFVISSVGLGSTLATGVLYVLAKFVVPADTLAWGWRIPFLLGGLLALVNYFIRRYLVETPEFKRLQVQREELKQESLSIKEPFLNLIRDYRREIALGIGMTWFVSSLVIFGLYFPAYIVQFYKHTKSDIYFAMTCGMLWSSFSLPICGIITDKLQKKEMMLVACLGFTLGGFSLFQLLASDSIWTLVGFMMLFQTVISFVTVSYFPLLTNVFPAAVRYTGLAACYNITYSIMGFAPTAITALIAWTGTPDAAIWFLTISALTSAVSTMLLFKKQSGVNEIVLEDDAVRTLSRKRKGYTFFPSVNFSFFKM